MRRIHAIATGGGAGLLAFTNNAAVRATAFAPNHAASENPEHAVGALPATAAGPLLQLISSRISQSSTDVVINRKTALEPKTVDLTCPGPTTCTLVAEQHVQIEGTGTGNKWAVCSHIDGAFMVE